MIGQVRQVLKQGLMQIYRPRIFILYRMSTVAANLQNPFPDLPLTYRFYDSDAEDYIFSLMNSFGIKYKDLRRKISERFKNGCQCCISFWDGVPCHYSWVCFGERDIMGLKLLLPANSCFIFDCCTLSEFRGRSIYPATLQHMGSVLVKKGYRRVFIDVESYNVASQRGVLKAGFQQVHLIKRRVFLNTYKRQYRRPIDDFLSKKLAQVAYSKSAVAMDSKPYVG